MARAMIAVLLLLLVVLLLAMASGTQRRPAGDYTCELMESD